MIVSQVSSQKGGGRPMGRQRRTKVNLKMRVARARDGWPDWLVAVTGLAATVVGLSLDEASAVTVSVPGGLAGVGAALGLIAALRFRRRLADDQREQEQRDVQKLQAAVQEPEERATEVIKKVVQEEGRNSAHAARVYFWLGVLVTVAVSVLVDVFAHFLPTIK